MTFFYTRKTRFENKKIKTWKALLVIPKNHAKLLT